MYEYTSTIENDASDCDKLNCVQEGRQKRVSLTVQGGDSNHACPYLVMVLSLRQYVFAGGEKRRNGFRDLIRPLDMKKLF